MAEASSTDDVITLRIRFKSETLERFTERYGGDLGPDEVFVRTKQPLPAGTAIAFDFTLNDGSPLLDGRGVVGWARAEGHPAGAPGMGVRFTSLSAQSWQTLRKILAGTGRGERDLATERRSTPLGPAKIDKPTPEDSERTEVARMPPTFFEAAAEGGPRNLEKTREMPIRGGFGRPGAGPTTNVPTPRRGNAPVDPHENEAIESLGLEDVEDARPTFGGTSGFEAWPAGRSNDPLGDWPSSQPSQAALAGPSRGGANVDPMLATAPTLPATAAVLLYDPDDPGGPLQPAGQALDGQSAGMAFNTAPSSGPHASPRTGTPAAFPPSAYSPLPGGGASSPLAATSPMPIYAPPPAQAGAPQSGPFSLPEGGQYGGTGFEGPRPTTSGGRVGRIGPAISPEEMALASSAVRGPEGGAPVWPGLPDDEEPRRGGTFKIWLALTLAAGGLIGAVLWLFPMLWPAPVGVGGQGAETVPADPSRRAGEASQRTAEVTVPSGAGAAAAGVAGAAGAAGAASGAAAAVPGAPGGGVGAAPAAVPGNAGATAPAAVPPPTVPGPKAGDPARPRGRASAEAEAAVDEPRPRRRRPRRTPSDVIAEAESRGTQELGAASAVAGETTGSALGPPGLSAPAPGPTAPVGGPVPGTPSSPPAVSPAPAEAGEDAYWLFVRSTPSGADVVIDGQVEGKTPFERRIFDPSRSYTLVVRKPGYAQTERTVTGTSEWVRRGNVRTLTVTARLPAEPGTEPAVTAPGQEKTNPFDEPAGSQP